MPDSAKVITLEPEVQKKARAKLARLPAPVHAVHDKGKQLILERLKKFFDRVDDSLFELADKAHSNQEQNLYFDAMREVRMRRRAIERDYAIAFDESFAALVDPGRPVAFTYDDDISLDELSLIQNEDLEEIVALDSTVARANSDYGEPIQHISLRLDSLVPVKVYQDNNPLGPKMLCSTFMAHAKRLRVDVKAKLVLFKLFDRLVIGDLGKVYRDINQLLVSHNILPSLSGVRRKTTARKRPAAPTPTASVARGPTYGQADNEMVKALGQLLGEQFITPASASQPINSELMHLLSMAQRVSSPLSAGVNTVDVRSLLGQLQNQQGTQVSTGRIDDEVMNLVNMLFEFILEDRNLAAPMKALISRMQIPIIKVAIVDRSFFTKGGHAARRLLNEMATAALGWEGKEKGLAKDPLFKKMEDIVQRLLSDFDTDVSIFADLLADFTSFLEKEQRRAAVLERRTLDAEDGKAKAEVARNIVAVELELRTIDQDLPEVVMRLLDDAWRNVLFVTALKYGYDSNEWQAGLQAIEDLVWSVKPPANMEERQQLIQAVPGLLKSLRAGLDTISYNPFEMSSLFKSLEEVHLACIRGVAAPAADAGRNVEQAISQVDESKSQADSPALTEKQANLPSAENKAAESHLSSDIEEVDELTPETMDHSLQKLDDELSEVLGEVEEPNATKVSDKQPIVKDSQANTRLAASTAPQVTEETQLPEDDVHWRQVEAFAQGAWFEMQGAGESMVEFSRCRLAAYIKPTGKYIFVNRNGMKVAEKSRNELAWALKKRTLRPLDNSVLFDRALEVVVSGLRKKDR